MSRELERIRCTECHATVSGHKLQSRDFGGPPEACDQSAHGSGSWPRRACDMLMQRFTLASRCYQALLPRTMRCSSFCIFWRTSLSSNNAISIFRIVAGRYCRACSLATSAASSARCCPRRERRTSSCPLATRQTVETQRACFIDRSREFGDVLVLLCDLTFVPRPSTRSTTSRAVVHGRL